MNVMSAYSCPTQNDARPAINTDLDAANSRSNTLEAPVLCVDLDGTLLATDGQPCFSLFGC